jgi:hypothetical protein
VIVDADIVIISSDGVYYTVNGDPYIAYTCVEPPEADLTGDCRVDMMDVAILVSEWLECGIEPPEACWE